MSSGSMSKIRPQRVQMSGDGFAAMATEKLSVWVWAVGVEDTARSNLFGGDVALAPGAHARVAVNCLGDLMRFAFHLSLRQSA